MQFFAVIQFPYLHLRSEPSFRYFLWGELLLDTIETLTSESNMSNLVTFNQSEQIVQFARDDR